MTGNSRPGQRPAPHMKRATRPRRARSPASPDGGHGHPPATYLARLSPPNPGRWLRALPTPANRRNRVPRARALPPPCRVGRQILRSTARRVARMLWTRKARDPRYQVVEVGRLARRPKTLSARWPGQYSALLLGFRAQSGPLAWVATVGRRSPVGAEDRVVVRSRGAVGVGRDGSGSKAPQYGRHGVNGNRNAARSAPLLSIQTRPSGRSHAAKPGDGVADRSEPLKNRRLALRLRDAA